eukprot:scaffold10520_cov122-Isochrysis_galbana.AAC.1
MRSRPQVEKRASTKGPAHTKAPGSSGRTVRPRRAGHAAACARLATVGSWYPRKIVKSTCRSEGTATQRGGAFAQGPQIRSPPAHAAQAARPRAAWAAASSPVPMDKKRPPLVHMLAERKGSIQPHPGPTKLFAGGAFRN